MESSKKLQLLTPLQNSFLIEFCRLTQGFYLTGGTALSAFYLQHRYSEDLGLFTNDDTFFQQADAWVREVTASLNVNYTAVQITSLL